MKKNQFILLLLLFAGRLSAQEEKIEPAYFYMPKHEIGISYGFFATPVIIVPLVHLFFPNINFDYWYNINQRRAVGATLSLFFDIRAPFGILISPQLNYRISYCQRNVNDFYFNFFSLASIGWKISTGSFSDNWVFEPLFPTIHVTVVGMRVGNRRDAATIELGYGTRGIIVVGYTHNFINNKKQKS